MSSNILKLFVEGIGALYNRTSELRGAGVNVRADAFSRRPARYNDAFIRATRPKSLRGAAFNSMLMPFTIEIRGLLGK